jgi:type II secretory pathway pseudopilin PulG
MTLVELLIAAAILVTVMGSTWLIFQGIMRAWRSGQLRTERYQQVRLLTDLFARELSSCVASARYPFVGVEAGSGTALKPGSAQDEVFFVGALPGRTGLVERGYWINQQQELMCHDEEPADGDYATGADEVCGVDVLQLELAYFDGTAWVPQWDGREGGAQAAQLPKAVRIVLQVGKDQTGGPFETIIAIPTG